MAGGGCVSAVHAVRLSNRAGKTDGGAKREEEIEASIGSSLSLPLILPNRRAAPSERCIMHYWGARGNYSRSNLNLKAAAAPFSARRVSH
jgi:hypothetical protein